MLKVILSHLSFFICVAANAQKMEAISSYINNPQVSKAAIDFYNKKFKASDDDKTGSIIDSLNTKNEKTRPFYIHLVSTMIPKADGALAEAVFTSCKDFFEEHPNSLIEFLYRTDPNSTMAYDWAMTISDVYTWESLAEAKVLIAASKKKTMAVIKEENKESLQHFYKKIERYAYAK